MEITLALVLPQLLPADVTYEIRAFAGKQDLFRKLEQRMRGYASWASGGGLGICVLLDEDREDCRDLKGRMEQAAAGAGLATKSLPGADGNFHVLNRIVVEELEAWFLGDGAAVCGAYPSVSAHFGQRAAYRDPDAVKGGTAEALERLLIRAGYHGGGLRKTEAAYQIASRMDAERNTSGSFQTFRSGLAALVATVTSQDEPDAA